MDQYTDQNSLYLHFPYGKIREYHKGHTISDLHLEVKTFKWLLEGAMDYFITLEDSENTLLVCQISETLSALGHNGLHAPGRYTYKAVVASDIARFFEIPIADLKASIATDLTNKMLKGITTAFYGQLRTALLKQTELLQPVRFAPLPKDREFFMSPQEDSSSIVKIMRCSPFLDQFQEDHLLQIAEIAERREYEPDELLYVQDQFTNGLYIMIEGTVSIKRITGNVEIKQRSITNVGFIFGWSCFLEKEDICNAITTEKTGVYFISYKQLRKVFKRDRNFERHFFSRLLWLISNQMNAAFLRYAGLLGKHNLQAVQQLIGNSKSRVPLNSPLHKVSHLLKNVNTKEMAYSCLHSLLADGSSLERHIASLSLDLLRQDREELHFMQRLQQVYKTVANHPCQDTGIVRKDCAKATRELFKDLDYRIEGWENLPETSGHIFLYNHLLNHRHYTLNNNFQITLDSHFISALILDKKYGDPGIRTVRIGRGQEYGHQNYYKKLGHINVYTPESEATSPEWQKKTRSVFYEQAKAHLQEGINILISPEGTSYRTEHSPGPFKLGSFKLAHSTTPEPFIVPLVLVNFDHRIQESTYYCKILKPFKLSEVSVDNHVDTLIGFVDRFQNTYAKEVSKARETSKSLNTTNHETNPVGHPPEMWCNEIKRLKRRVLKKTDQEDLIAFYGSSSIRLWVALKKDLLPLNTINLGFGGSSFAWCIHYFDEIFKGLAPKKIVLYAGENDLADGKSPQEVLADCKELVGKIGYQFPQAAIALISLKPSVAREPMIPQIMETNLLLSKYIIGELNAQFINVFSQMITSDNRPKPELFLSDGLHLNRAGYQIWASVVRASLVSIPENDTYENVLIPDGHKDQNQKLR